ncbi:hypothetical protein [Powai lake megavirus]|uniref:Uncharacterized protein n=1 Tax=Powai lake megavirus TaxID=1842663 RepID=A0A161HUY1_9VIRU|nr:hypothetical protein QJ849_gp788 [Powai lake megavirus]ANB50950.1 hypothetical protein [Powai lake megavirus]
MKRIISKINKLNHKQLEELQPIIIQRQLKIIDEKLKQDIVPKIFQKYISDIHFYTNYNINNDNDNDNELYGILYGVGGICFGSQLKLSSRYEVSKKSDNIYTNVDITMTILNNEYKSTHVIEYEHKKKWYTSKKDNIINIKISSNALVVLDKLGLSDNLYHRKMLAILIHNIYTKSIMICKDDDSDEILVSNKLLCQYNKKSQLKNLEYVYINTDQNPKILFKFV